MSDNIEEVLNELRATTERLGAQHAETKTMAAKAEKLFSDQEEKSQRLTSDLEAAKKSSAEAAERLDALEMELSRKGGPGTGRDYKESPEYKAIAAYVSRGTDDMDTEQKSILMRSDSGPDGGYLTTPELDNVIIKGITEISPIRSVARVRTVSRKTLQAPVRTGIPKASYEGEAEDGDESQSKYGSASLTVHRLTTTIPMTTDLLLDTAFDFESEVMADVSEAFAFAEGRNFVLGDGVKKPMGYLSVAAGLQDDARISGASGKLDGDDIIRLTGDLKVGYNPVFALNRRTLAEIRLLKGTDGHYIFQPGLNGQIPNQIAGFNYILMEDMPDIAANAIPLSFQDFRRGYTIIDRTGTEVIRDNLTGKKAAIVELTFHRYNHGQVTLKEAFKLLKIKP
ncbi:phage major capsid protein [Pseudomonas arsenicoxydans]|uniref:Phage major capsid protein n=1 Tax=Pseudomonas arsenicoxydans TaxID=702115 RepID=A0A502HT88_9PSED|nr:phage major capsid protein [Pseudomonas arsenicoxydans]TPG76320.1 phage major capsid protein [Pseudomonas arsenicoxydans]